MISGAGVFYLVAIILVAPIVMYQVYGAVLRVARRRRKGRCWRLDFIREVNNVIGIVVEEKGRDFPQIGLVTKVGDEEQLILLTVEGEGKAASRLRERAPAP